MVTTGQAIFLAGKWQGQGSVKPNGPQYLEMSEFKVLKTSPVTIVNVQQFTKHLESGAPLHAENGFFKIFPSKSDDGDVCTVEASYSHPFGMNEFEFGTLSANTLSL